MPELEDEECAGDLHSDFSRVCDGEAVLDLEQGAELAASVANVKLVSTVAEHGVVAGN